MKHSKIICAVLAITLTTPALGDEYGVTNPEELSMEGMMDRMRHGQAHPMDYAIGYGAAKAGRHEDAREIFQSAIEHTNSAQAMTWMSWLEDNGLGGMENPSAAAEWDRKAAELGSEVAAFNYGLDLMRGRGVPRDDIAGRKMIDRAAAMGDATARHLVENDYDLDSVTPDADEWKYELNLF
ncbi:MAG: tetratricopeptide repeat protein [Sulfitobacter sp.]